ncbi:hypothetical protein [Actinoplanes sp. NPDC049265]
MIRTPTGSVVAALTITLRPGAPAATGLLLARNRGTCVNTPGVPSMTS